MGEEGVSDSGIAEPDVNRVVQRQFFEYAGPLFSIVISPASSTVSVNEGRRLRALPRDRSHRHVDDDLQVHWEIVEGDGSLVRTTDRQVEYLEPDTRVSHV